MCVLGLRFISRVRARARVEHLAGIGDQTLQNHTNKRQAIIGERIPVNFNFFALFFFFFSKEPARMGEQANRYIINRE